MHISMNLITAKTYVHNQTTQINHIKPNNTKPIITTTTSYTLQKFISMAYTLALFKPDLIRTPNYTKTRSKILHHAEKNGLKVKANTYLDRWHRSQVEAFYGTHKGKFFYPRLIQVMRYTLTKNSQSVQVQ